MPGMLLLKWYGVVDNIRCLVLPFGGISLFMVQSILLLLRCKYSNKYWKYQLFTIWESFTEYKTKYIDDDEQQCRLVDFGLVRFIGVYGEHIDQRTNQTMLGSPLMCLSTYMKETIHLAR